MKTERLLKRLATAVARLKDSDALSRVVILLTDGVNNRGEVTPLMAAEIAKTYGIRVYTIGVGAHGMAPYPVMTPYGVQLQQMLVEIDEELLRQMAEMTGGAYFRATDNTKLISIYGQINKMEKSKTQVDSFPVYKELFMIFALTALFAFGFGIPDTLGCFKKNTLNAYDTDSSGTVLMDSCSYSFAFWPMECTEGMENVCLKFGDPELMKPLMPDVSPRKGWLKMVLFSLGLFFLSWGCPVRAPEPE